MRVTVRLRYRYYVGEATLLKNMCTFLAFKGTIVGILRLFFVDSDSSDAAKSSLKFSTRLLLLDPPFRFREYVLVAGVKGLLFKLALRLSSIRLLEAAGGGGDLR